MANTVFQISFYNIRTMLFYDALIMLSYES